MSESHHECRAIQRSRDPHQDALTVTFLDTDGAGTADASHREARKLCAEYAQGVQRKRRVTQRLWLRVLVVVGLGSAALCLWPGVVERMW